MLEQLDLDKLYEIKQIRFLLHTLHVCDMGSHGRIGRSQFLWIYASHSKKFVFYSKRDEKSFEDFKSKQMK
jgi:hypothetical protein